MSIWRRFEGHGLPSLITTNIDGREPILASKEAAKLLLQVVEEVRHETRFELLAFVVMPDHIHLVLAMPPKIAFRRVMRLIKGRFAHRYNRLRRRSGPLWQGRYHERALRSERELLAAIEYVHGNPVKAGLAGQAASFPWSSANPTFRTELDAYVV